MNFLTQNPAQIVRHNLRADTPQLTKLKSLLVLAMVLTFFVHTAQSQELALQSIKIGPKAGVNFSHWGGDNFNTKAVTAWHFGGFVQLQFSERYELQSELIYSVTGSERKIRCGCANSSNEFTLPYLSLPILATYKITPKLYINLGPQISFLLNAKDEHDAEFKEEFKSADLGLAIGAGYELPVGVQFQIRYVAGISNFNNEELYDEKTSNQVFQISVAYVLLKKEPKP